MVVQSAPHSRNPIYTYASMLHAAAFHYILPETLFFTLVATVVSVVSEKTGYSLGISNQMLTVLGAVLGLVVSFRTSSAYDRYYEARKLWTTIGVTSRNLARLIWIQVPSERVDKEAKSLHDGTKPKQSELKILLEKKSMMLLVEAYSVAVKHALRGERGIHYSDLYHLVCFLPTFSPSTFSVLQRKPESPSPWTSSSATLVVTPELERYSSTHYPFPTPSETFSNATGILSEGACSGDNSAAALGMRRGISLEDAQQRRKTFDPETSIPSNPLHTPLAAARPPSNKAQVYECLPMMLQPFVDLIGYFGSRIRLQLVRHAVMKVEKSVQNETVDHGDGSAVVQPNVPQEILLYLSSYLQWLLKNDLLKPAIAIALTNAIVSLDDTMVHLDRIRTTPIPNAYRTHLRLSIWLYLFFLPFQIFNTFGYLTIPASALYSYVLLGFMEIGREIENPFVCLMNNLDLDEFCSNIQRELHEISAHTTPDPYSYILGDYHRPLAPADRSSARGILARSSLSYANGTEGDLEKTSNEPGPGIREDNVLAHVKVTLWENRRMMGIRAA